jgi:exodeoxyribonuclease III
VGESLWLLSWNVNGLRAMLRKRGFDFLRRQDVDILCLQETRATAEQALADPSRPLFPELPHQYFNPAQKPGYSGTAAFCAPRPLQVRRGMGGMEHDREGRLLTLEFERFFLVNIYVPNAQRGLLRLDYRLRWDRSLRRYLVGLDRPSRWSSAGT